MLEEIFLPLSLQQQIRRRRQHDDKKSLSSSSSCGRSLSADISIEMSLEHIFSMARAELETFMSQLWTTTGGKIGGGWLVNKILSLFSCPYCHFTEDESSFSAQNTQALFNTLFHRAGYFSSVEIYFTFFRGKSSCNIAIKTINSYKRFVKDPCICGNH